MNWASEQFQVQPGEQARRRRVSSPWKAEGWLWVCTATRSSAGWTEYRGHPCGEAPALSSYQGEGAHEGLTVVLSDGQKTEN